MSAIVSKKMEIFVKNGDVFDENRLFGKSNTGTYFISSKEDFDLFAPFFMDGLIYMFDLTKIEIYRILFKKFYFQTRNKYIDKMDNFDSYCDHFLNYAKNPVVEIRQRINDERVFFRFDDNNLPCIINFRKILYGNISKIVFEIVKNNCYIYPEIIVPNIETTNNELEKEDI